MLSKVVQLCPGLIRTNCQRHEIVYMTKYLISWNVCATQEQRIFKNILAHDNYILFVKSHLKNNWLLWTVHAEFCHLMTLIIYANCIVIEIHVIRLWWTTKSIQFYESVYSSCWYDWVYSVHWNPSCACLIINLKADTL